MLGKQGVFCFQGTRYLVFKGKSEGTTSLGSPPKKSHFLFEGLFLWSKEKDSLGECMSSFFGDPHWFQYGSQAKDSYGVENMELGAKGMTLSFPMPELNARDKTGVFSENYTIF